MINFNFRRLIIITTITGSILGSCNNDTSQNTNEAGNKAMADSTLDYNAQPLVSHIYTADPSAHVFNNRIYIYSSHDTATGTPEDDLGSHFNMMDYHILSMDRSALKPLMERIQTGLL